MSNKRKDCLILISDGLCDSYIFNSGKAVLKLEIGTICLKLCPRK